MPRAALVTLASALLAGCTATTPGPRLYVFDCGSIGLADVESFGLSGEETDVRELFVPCYLVEHPEGHLLLAGDLYHFRASRRLRRTPDFNTDREATLRSMDRVQAVVKERGATLWIEHDKALADTLRLAPGYYE